MLSFPAVPCALEIEDIGVIFEKICLGPSIHPLVRPQEQTLLPLTPDIAITTQPAHSTSLCSPSSPPPSSSFSFQPPAPTHPHLLPLVASVCAPWPFATQTRSQTCGAHRHASTRAVLWSRQQEESAVGVDGIWGNHLLYASSMSGICSCLRPQRHSAPVPSLTAIERTGASLISGPMRMFATTTSN